MVVPSQRAVRRDLIWVAAILYGGYCALAISRADVFLAKIGLFPAPVLVFFTLSVAMAVLAGCARRVRWSELSSPYGLILMPLMLLAVVALMQLPRSENSVEGVKYAFMPLASLFAVGLAPIALAVFTTWQGWRAALIGALALLFGSLAVDVAIPGTLSNVLSRPAGFPENPNQTAAIVCMLAALLLDYRRATVGSFVLLFVCGIAVLATLSRGGMVLFAFVVLAFLSSTWMLSARRMKVRTYGFLVVVIGLAIVGGAQLVESSDAYRTAGAQRRLGILSGERSFVRADDARLQIAQVAISEVELRPIAGHGPAASRLRAIAPHNLYLSLWWDYGVLAVLAYVVLLGAGILLSLHKLQIGAAVFFVVLSLASLFSHTLLDVRAVHFAIATAIVMCARARSRDVSIRMRPIDASDGSCPSDRIGPTT